MPAPPPPPGGDQRHHVAPVPPAASRLRLFRRSGGSRRQSATRLDGKHRKSRERHLAAWTGAHGERAALQGPYTAGRRAGGRCSRLALARSAWTPWHADPGQSLPRQRQAIRCRDSSTLGSHHNGGTLGDLRPGRKRHTRVLRRHRTRVPPASNLSPPRSSSGLTRCFLSFIPHNNAARIVMAGGAASTSYSHSFRDTDAGGARTPAGGRRRARMTGPASIGRWTRSTAHGGMAAGSTPPAGTLLRALPACDDPTRGQLRVLPSPLFCRDRREPSLL